MQLPALFLTYQLFWVFSWHIYDPYLSSVPVEPENSKQQQSIYRSTPKINLTPPQKTGNKQRERTHELLDYSKSNIVVSLVLKISDKTAQLMQSAVCIHQQNIWLTCFFAYLILKKNQWSYKNNFTSSTSTAKSSYCVGY